ncbi:MAG: class I SAM-dependent methyltransferase [Patescibacteria group bacterium]|nr:class I SAM-dependent methyltransferase [Patescibacteria group bacterium]
MHIFREISEKKPKRVLEAGCGRGFYMHALTFFDDIQEIHGIDVIDEYLEVARSHISDTRVHLQNANIYSLPFPDGHFDAVICSEVLEHLEDDLKALKELKRVLAKDGTLLVSVPCKDYPFLWDPLNWILERLFGTHVPKDIWWLAGIWADHERLYTRSQLEELARKAELKPARTEMLVSSSWPFSHFLLYGIGKNIVTRLGVKQFDRFHFEPKPVSAALAWLMRLPTTWRRSEKVAVDIFMKLIR